MLSLAIQYMSLSVLSLHNLTLCIHVYVNTVWSGVSELADSWYYKPTVSLSWSHVTAPEQLAARYTIPDTTAS